VPPDHAGEARFLYGTALIRAAERTSAGLARDHWLKAREQLEEAEKLGVPEADQGRLQYRLGKAGFYSEADPAGVAERLAAAVKSADGPAEGYNLLARAYLRLKPPDLPPPSKPTNSCGSSRRCWSTTKPSRRRGWTAANCCCACSGRTRPARCSNWSAPRRRRRC